MKRIYKIRTQQLVKDESIVKFRVNCKCIRDLEMIDLLNSTGIRVGELVKLNRNNIDFEERECIVFGKDNKERKVYINQSKPNF